MSFPRVDAWQNGRNAAGSDGKTPAARSSSQPKTHRHPVKHLLTLGIAFLLFAHGAQAANTWYVDVQGAPPGTGTSADPYTSLQFALDRPTTLAGDTLVVRPGSYDEAISTSKSVRIQSEQGAEVTLIRGTPATTGALVHLSAFDNFPFLILEGFTLRPQTSSANIGIQSSGSTVRRCIIEGFSSTGIVNAYETVVSQSTICKNNTGFFHPAFSGLSMTTSILWGNGVDLIHIGASSISHCAGFAVVTGAPLPPNNLVGDPGLWDLAHDDFHLRPGSICIDAGLGTDPDGSVGDIGALRFDAGYATGPAIYCALQPTSDGCVASISASGLCSASSPDPFLVTATTVMANKTGRLLYSFGEANTPFQGGILCLALPLTRTEVSNSGSNGLPPPLDACSGVLSYDFNARVQSGVDPLLLPGTVVYAQYRFRDPFEVSGSGVGWSDAVRFGIAP